MRSKLKPRPRTSDEGREIIDRARNEWSRGPHGVEERMAIMAARVALNMYRERCRGNPWWTIGASDELLLTTLSHDMEHSDAGTS